MSTTQIRAVLHHFIDVADDQLINLLYAIVKEHKEENVEISKEYQKILDLSQDHRHNSEDLESNWEEVRKKLQEEV